MKRVIWIGIICFICAMQLEAKELSIKIKSKYGVLINAKTGKILFGKNHLDKIYPASTTKIATLLYILASYPNLELDKQITVYAKDITKISEKNKIASNFSLPAFLLEYDGTEMGLQPGETITLKSLFYGLMLGSANDGANVLASYFDNNIDQFMLKLNLFLKDIGCMNTQLLNPHGLFHPNHYSTPYDLALITKKALEYPLFKEIVGTKEYTSPETNKSKAKKIIQSNKLLQEGNFYSPYAYGVKTGYTRKAGNNLVAAASNGSRDLIAVVNKLPERNQIFRDALTMFEAAFNEEKINRLLFNKEESFYFVPVKNGVKKVRGELRENVYIDYYPSEEMEIITNQVWYDLKAPVNKGDIIGELHIYDEEENLINKSYYYASYPVKQRVIAKFMEICKKIIFTRYTWVAILLILIIGIWKKVKYGHFSFRA